MFSRTTWLYLTRPAEWLADWLSTTQPTKEGETIRVGVNGRPVSSFGERDEGKLFYDEEGKVIPFIEFQVV